MNEIELIELLTAPGFFRFLAQQANLDPEEAKRIYAQDPYREAKLWERIEIRPFAVVAGGFKE